MHAHSLGNDAEAVEIVRDMLRLAEATADQSPLLVPSLVSISINQMAASTLTQLSYELRIARSSGDGPVQDGAATETQIQELLTEVLRSIPSDTLGRGIRGEGFMVYDTLVDSLALQPGLMAPSPLMLAMTPAFRLEAIKMMRVATDAESAVRNDSYPEAIAAHRIADLDSSTNVFVYPPEQLSLLVGTSYRKVFELHYRTWAINRATVLRLAIHWYRSEHNGEFPPTLDNLVPRYLRQLPTDPFSATPRPFGYLRGDRPILYSVGLNGMDDLGSSARPNGIARPVDDAEPGGPFDRFNLQRSDLIFPLLSPLPPVPDQDDPFLTVEGSEPSLPATTTPAE
jgi:hypothetical protein